MIHLIVPKKSFRLAVSRNRLRRRLRAALDQIRPGWRTELEGKIFATPEMPSLPWTEFKAKIVFLLEKSKII